jgi:hypothetical protein
MGPCRQCSAPGCYGFEVMPARPRQDVHGPVLSTVTMWSEHGPTLAQKRLALAALIERWNKGNRSHKLHSRIYSARHEILKLELTSKGQS